MAGFNLMALGAGLGQFAEQYQRQQDAAIRQQMLQLSLAKLQDELNERKILRDAAELQFGGLGLPGAGTQMSPIQTHQQPGAGMAPQSPVAPSPSPRQSFGAVGEYGVGQDTGYPFPTQGASAAFPQLGRSGSNQIPVAGPGAPSQIGSSQSGLDQIPPPRPGGAGSPADRGLPATDRAPQLADAGPAATGGQPSGGDAPPVEPPSTREIALWLRQNNPTMDSRTIIAAANGLSEKLQAEYQQRLKAWQIVGGGHERARREKREDLTFAAGLPQREAPKVLVGPGGQRIEWQPGTPLPQGPGWYPLGGTEPEAKGRTQITLDSGVTVTGVPGKGDTWTTMTGEPLTPAQRKELNEGRINKFGSASGAVNPETVQGVAQGIANYTLAPMTSWAMRSPFGQAVMAEVKKLNPDYDQAKYDQRKRGLVAFTTGRQGDSVRSFSVSIDHLATMEDAAKAIETGDVQVLNRVAQYVKQQFGYEAPVDFDFVKNVVGGEISKAIIGGIGGVTDREEMRNAFQRANSPEQLAGVARYAKRLMAGQLDGYRRQSESAGFPTKDFDAALSPRARQELEGLNAPGAAAQPTSGLPGGRGTGQSMSDPAVPASPEDAAKLPSGTYYVLPSDPDTVRRRK